MVSSSAPSFAHSKRVKQVESLECLVPIFQGCFGPGMNEHHCLPYPVPLALYHSNPLSQNVDVILVLAEGPSSPYSPDSHFVNVVSSVSVCLSSQNSASRMIHPVTFVGRGMGSIWDLKLQR